MQHSHLRRRGRVLTAIAAAVTLTAITGVTVAPSEAAAPGTSTLDTAFGWLTGQLTDGAIHNDQYDFDDFGLTIDVELALDTVDLSEAPTIVEALYSEALVLADEARAAFDLSGRLTTASEDEDLARIALSCEALRTTTRMMHAIAWLLNQRAYFAGELSEFQLQRHGRLPRPQPEAAPEQLAMLGPELEDLVAVTLGVERERVLEAGATAPADSDPQAGGLDLGTLTGQELLHLLGASVGEGDHRFRKNSAR